MKFSEKNFLSEQKPELKSGFSEQLEQIGLNEKSDAFFNLYLLDAHRLLLAKAEIKSPEDFEKYMSLHSESLPELYNEMLARESVKDSETFQNFKRSLDDLFTTINDGKELSVEMDTGVISQVVGAIDNETQLQASSQIDLLKDKDLTEIIKFEIKKNTRGSAGFVAGQSGDKQFAREIRIIFS